MRKNTTLFAWITAGILSFTLTSCDEDAMISDTLQGTWKGYMSVYQEYNGRVYQSTYSIIDFVKDPYTYTSGRGYWIDYYSGAPFDYIANHIDWKVSNGIIYVYFIEENAQVEIGNYHLSDGRFVGTIYYNDKRIDFSLQHISSPNWDDYDYGWDYWTKAYKFANDSTSYMPASKKSPQRFFQ